MMFLVTGWERVAHDLRILLEAIRNPNAPFPLPPPGTYIHTQTFIQFIVHCFCSFES